MLYNEHVGRRFILALCSGSCTHGLPAVKVFGIGHVLVRQTYVSGTVTDGLGVVVVWLRNFDLSSKSLSLYTVGAALGFIWPEATFLLVLVGCLC